MKRSAQMATLKKVLRELGTLKGYLILSLLLSALTVALTLYLPVLTGDAVDLLIGPGQVDFVGIARLIKIGVAVVILTGVFQYLGSLCNNRLTYQLVQRLRNKAIRAIQRLPLSYLDGRTSGEMVSRMIADVDQMADGLLLGFSQLFTGVMTILGTLFFMLSVNVKIAAIVVCLTPISLLVAAFIASRTFSMFQLQSSIRGEQTSLIDESLYGQKVVQAFGYEARAQERFDEINERLEKASIRATFFSSITNPSTRFVNSLVYMGVGVFGALSCISGQLTVGQLSCFLSYANQYTKPFNDIAGVITELQNALACASRIFEIIEAEPEIPDAPDAKVLGQARGAVTLEDVSFSYTPERKLIEHFCLNVKPGQRIAIVGPTGCGKTTVINLLMRFYEVNGGKITVDGVDIRHMTRESLRRNYGMILQETWLKGGTIRENIAMGRPEATEEEVIAAAKASHADSFIRRLPKGYDTVISEDGDGLSQGQKQLLCISRVMLAIPPMLILDEATSSIDTRTEQKIQNAFAKLMEGRTSFIVAHRLSTIQNADLILVMKDGSIIEQGTHSELLRKGGFYAQLYQSQFAT